MPAHFAARSHPTLAVLLLTALIGRAPTQCGAPHWAQGYGTLGPDGPVLASANWDPDGPGPLPPRLVVGGDFDTVRGLPANNVALYDYGTGTWSPLADGVDGVVRAIHAGPNGELVVGGEFVTAGGATVNSIARWTGTDWTGLGGGVLQGLGALGTVHAMATMPNGDLLVGGLFYTAGPFVSPGIARWNGTGWIAMGGTNWVKALAVRPNGDVIAAGSFPFGFAAYAVGRWTGSGWALVTAAIPLGITESIHALAALPNGDVIAGGSFASISGVPVNNIARWNGSAWSAIGSGVTGAVYTILPASNPVAFYVGGNLQGAGGLAAANFAAWSGSSWSAPGSVGYGSAAAASVRTLTSHVLGGVVLGGGFDLAGGQPAANVALFFGGPVPIVPLGATTNGKVSALAALPNGQLLVGGEFTRIWNRSANRVALWTGTEWTALGTGVDDAVAAVARLPNGDLVVGGTFTQAGGVVVNRIARWNGTNWAALGAGLDAPVRSLAVTYSGEVVAGGEFTGRLRRWNGASWLPLGAGGDPNAIVWALDVMPNGDLVAGGAFTAIGASPVSYLGRWNGTNWSSFGTGVNSAVASILPLPNGELIAGGIFTSAGGVSVRRIARWDGSSWSAMGAGFDGPIAVRAIERLPGGDIVAAGDFVASGGTSVEHIARWNGASWDPVDGGMPGATSNVWALATMSTGELVAGGTFATAGSAYSPNLARLVAGCPAGVVPFGNACGPHVLVAETPPWLGTTFATHTTCTSPCIPVLVTGTAPTFVPLASLYPQGLPGCNLWVTPDILSVVTPIFGQVFGYVALPNTPSLAGLSFHQQVVEVRLDLTGAFTQLASTNALEVTIGSY